MKNSSSFFIILLAAAVIIRLLTVFFVPTFDAPDEEPHFKYIQYIATRGELPQAYSTTEQPTNDWEYYQPPLYYILGSLLMSKNAFASFYILRVSSIILFAVSLLFSRKILEKLPLENWQKKCSLLFIALLPTGIFVSSSINNDNLIICITTIIIYLTTVLNLNKQKSATILGLWIAVAIVTKLSAFVVIGYVTLFYLMAYFKHRRVKTLYNLAICGIISLLASSLLFIRNFYLYGSILGYEFSNKPNDTLRNSFEKIAHTFHMTTWSFYSVSGIYNNVRPFNWPFSYLILATVLLGIMALYTCKSNRLYQIFCISLLSNVVFVFWFGYLYNQSQGRFLLPSLFFIAVLFSIGLKKLRDLIPIVSNRRVLQAVVLFLMLGFCLTIFKLEMQRQQRKISTEIPHLHSFNAQKKSPEKSGDL